MKNYYEILQVNEKASKEIIEKAYKVLVKKYHPDLQKDAKKKDILDQKLKQINEAYDVLSDEFLREQYDFEFQKEKEEKLKQKYGEKSYRTERNNFYNNQSNIQQENNNIQRKKDLNNNDKDIEEKNSHLGTFDGVIDLAKMLYKDRPKRQEIKEMTKKDLIAIFLTILVVIALGLILWCIPFTQGFIKEFLFENPVFQWIGNIFSNAE